MNWEDWIHSTCGSMVELEDGVLNVRKDAARKLEGS